MPAFRRIAGTTPVAFADGKATGTDLAAPSGAEIRVDLRPQQRLVALRRQGGGFRGLDALHWQLWNRADAAQKLDDLCRLHGLPLDDPESVEEPELRYDAALAFRAPGVPPPLSHLIDLPQGSDAVARLTGDHDGLEAVDQALIGWAIAANRRPGSLPVVHHFLDDPGSTPVEAWRTDALLLLAPVSN